MGGPVPWVGGGQMGDYDVMRGWTNRSVERASKG